MEVSVVLQEAPPVFTELLELTEYRDRVREWREVARWANLFFVIYFKKVIK